MSVVFTDVTGSTALAESLDPESMRRVMSRYFDAMSTVIERHGGAVEKFIGDAIMAVFGILQLHEDDALRAVRTAAAMRERLAGLNDELARDHGVRIETRTGVNTGEVVAGDPQAGQLLVTGDTVNVAARLQQSANPGEILLGAETHWLVKDVVRVQPLAPLDLKGKSEPVAAYRLLEVLKDAPAIARRFDTPFLGRGRELGILREQLAACARERNCRLVTVLGAPGIGKSRLVWELIAGRGEAGFVVGRCLPYGEGVTYWPLVEIVKQIAGDDARAVATLVDEDGDIVAGRIADAVGQSEGSATPEETFWAVRKLLESLARERPLVVMLDDLEWAEPTFLDLIEYVLGFSSGASILLLAVARPELLERRPSWTSPRRNSTSLVLEPLSERESGSLVDRLVGGDDLPEELRVRILDAAEGNPLFVEQMLAMGAESDLTEIRVPPTMQALLAARIDRLDPNERTIIERASFEGRRFHRSAVVDLAPPQLRPTVSTHLLALVRKGFIRPDRAEFTDDDAFRYLHNLIRDAAYAGIPKELRSDLHERFANWLERKAGSRSREYEEILGYHFEQAYRYRAELGPLDGRARELGRRAGELLGDAGDRAVARLDMTAATSLLDRALAVLPAGHPRENELRLALGDALIETGDLARGNDMLKEVAANAVAEGDSTNEWRARVRLAWAQQIAGELPAEDAIGLAEQAVSVLTPLGDDAGLAAAWQLAAQGQNALSNMQEVHRGMERALDHARRAHNVRLETESLFWIGLAVFFGDAAVTEALQICHALDESAQTPLQRAHAKFWLAAVRGLAGDDMVGVRRELEGARKMYRELGLETIWAGTAIACGYVELHAGDPAIAERILRESDAALRPTGVDAYRCTVLADLGEALIAQGRYAEADLVTAECATITPPGDVLTLAILASVKGRLAAHRGALVDAESAAQDALSQLERTPAASYVVKGDALMALAEIERLAHGPAKARANAQRALELYERKGVVPAMERTRQYVAALQTT